MSNPATLTANFTSDFDAQTLSGTVTFATESGTPTISYREWGYGSWGQQGDWGQWSPKRLRLIGSESDAVSLDPAGIISPATGSLAVVVKLIEDAGAEEIYGECGVKGVGTDHMRWGVDSSDHPFVEWSSNNAAYQRLTGTETISVDTEYLFYVGWTGLTQELSIDAASKHVGTRDAVQGSWGSGDLVLMAG